MIKQNRRQFLKWAALGIGTGAIGGPNLQALGGEENAERPDVIFIFTDQQHAGMMSCAGNPHLETPAMDYIAANGIRFTRAYPTNPVCSPARVGIMTGRFPGSFDDDRNRPARENGGSMRIPEISDEVRQTTIAAHLKRAGYDLVYGGKEHLPKPLIPARLGFNDISNNERDGLAKTAADYIRGKHDRPYFMWINLINPHDICYYALRGHLTFDDPNFPPKTVFYEESANVPFAAMWKGHIPAGKVDSTHLVSNGLDVLPTVCDYAGVESKADPRGRSLRPLFEGKHIAWRDTLGVESQIGRMVVDQAGYKYILYDFAGREEQLLDMGKRPLESEQFADDPAYADKLSELRAAYHEIWFPAQGR